MTDLNLCIIVLNWNSINDSLRALRVLTSSPWDVCVVDNGSSDGHEISRIHQAYPDISVLETGRNLGYAGGMNTGMKWALSQGYSHALLLNPDTTPSSEVIQAMLRLSDGSAVVGTAQVTDDRTPYVSAANLNGRKIVPFQCSTSCGLGHDVDVVSGAGILIDLPVAESLGFIDEKYFHYKEEFDFCYRVTASGRKIRYSCGESLVHRRGGSLAGSSPSAMYYSCRNEILFLKKHFGALGWLSSPGIIRMALVSMLKAPRNSAAILRGLLHGIFGISGPISNLSKVRTGQ